jgi:transposase
VSSFDLTHDPKPTVVRRLEVITDVGGRRKWSVDAKAEIMLEALAPGAVVSEVARRHDLRPQQLFGWLREARQAPPGGPAFVPVVIEPDPPGPRPLGGIISECRAGTDRNGGRDQIGIVGGIKSECRARSRRNPHPILARRVPIQVWRVSVEKGARSEGCCLNL